MRVGRMPRSKERVRMVLLGEPVDVPRVLVTLGRAADRLLKFTVITAAIWIASEIGWAFLDGAVRRAVGQ